MDKLAQEIEYFEIHFKKFLTYILDLVRNKRCGLENMSKLILQLKIKDAT